MDYFPFQTRDPKFQCYFVFQRGSKENLYPRSSSHCTAYLLPRPRWKSSQRENDYSMTGVFSIEASGKGTGNLKMS